MIIETLKCLTLFQNYYFLLPSYFYIIAVTKKYFHLSRNNCIFYNSFGGFLLVYYLAVNQGSDSRKCEKMGAGLESYLAMKAVGLCQV